MFLQTQGITKEFGKLRAVNNVNLEIVKGDIHAIIGPNGAGKTTFFNLLTGFHRADSGRILFEGAEITGRPSHEIARLGISRAFQISNIFPKLTVLENVLLPAIVARSGGRLARRLWRGRLARGPVTAPCADPPT